jgi:uracil-DNA glycosylase family 4
MSFSPLVQIDSHKHTSSHAKRAKSHGNDAKKRFTDRIERVNEIINQVHEIKVGRRGCDYCPLNKIHGINKVFGKVRGKDIFIWAQSPGAQENKFKEELIGPSGKFLWYELARVGIKRKHCDIQNVVRCWPVDIDDSRYPPFISRSPTKEEVKCCSVYNEEALQKSRAKLHLVFGQVAAASLLKQEFKKDKRIFYSDNLKGWVVYLDHPSYFLHMGFSAGDGRDANVPLKRFRADLDKAKALLKNKSFDRFKFLKEQNYIGVTTRKQAQKVYGKLKRYAIEKGVRLVADMEEGKVDEHGRAYDRGRSVALCCGFAAAPGTSYTFILEHPNEAVHKSARIYNRRIVKKLLRYSSIKKSFHFGVSDVDSVKRLLDTRVEGFDYDTLTAEFFKDPNAKAYGLDAIADRRYPNFIDYKSIEGPDAFTHEFKKLLKEKKYAKLTLKKQVMLGRRRNAINLARLPWKKMILYNGADCHLEKLVEQDTIKYVHQPLMDVYMDSNYILYRMQREKNCKPIFDYHWHKKVDKLYSKRIKKHEHKLRKIAGKYAYIKNKKGVRVKKKFNPGSPEQIAWLLYDKLKIPIPRDDDGNKKRTTRANVLKVLARRYKKAILPVKYREMTKGKSTYIDGYLKCANLNEGHLRTNWKQTGTSTGRLSSGKSKDKSNDAVINFQNIHGDPFIKCLLVAHRAWRKLYDYWLKHGDFTKKTWQKFKNFYAQLGFDFSQNELRQLAEESGDKNLIAAFTTTEQWYCTKCEKYHPSDPHVEVGHGLTGWSRESIAHDERVRKLVKNMQFGLVFGLQGEGLFAFLVAQGVETTLEEVEDFHEKYFKKYPGVKKLQKRYRDFAERHGYIVNQFGFRRKLNVKEQQEQGSEYEGSYWGNQAINTPIQGAAHQLLLMSVAMLHRKPKKYNLLKYPQMEIHDALYFRVKLKYLWNAFKQGHDLMVNAPVKIMKECFKIKKKVALASKPKAGFRFGVQVEGIGGEGLENVWDFLNAWCRENKALEKSYYKELAKLES